MRDDRRSRIAKIHAAVNELKANRHLFGEESYGVILFALNEQLRMLRTLTLQPGEAVVSGDELRQVTVMFVDVKDSTEMAYRLGAETWKTIMDSAHRLLNNILDQWDGEVGQYLGDGLLCFFGAQRSRGDDALRAVACALDMQQSLETFSVAIQREHQAAFQARIGISTGEVIVGMIGTASKSEFLALGTTTNLAARLQDLARPGSVLIDEQTYQRVRNQFVTEEQPPVRVKGFDTALPYYVVLRRRQQDEHMTTQEIASIAIPFVGRVEELARITVAAEHALVSEPFQVITVYGDTGVGKTRLLEEAVRRLREHRYTLLRITSQYEKRTSSYGLLRTLLATACNITSSTLPQEAQIRIRRHLEHTWHNAPASAAPVIGYLAGYGFEDDPAVELLKSSSQQQWMIAYDIISRWFCAMAMQNPLLIMIDNLHWMDRPSIELLELIANDLAPYRGLLLATARQDFQHQYPAYMRAIAERHIEVSLPPLDNTDTATLISTILHTVQNLPTALIPTLSERAAGNPLFVEELVRMLFDNGAFEPTRDGHWRVNLLRYDAALQGLPGGLQGVLQARLDDLAAGARQVLQYASVVGQQFWEGVVSHLAGFNTNATLEDLVARGILIHVQGSAFPETREYAFRLALYREAAYQMLTNVTRKRYHEEVIQWLFSRVDENPQALPLLAEQLEAAQHFEQALSVYYRAAAYRFQQGFLNATHKLIETGLRIAGNIPREVALPEVSRLWLMQGRVLSAQHRYEEATAACQAALMLMEELPASTMLEERIIAAQTLGSAYRSMGNYDDAFNALNHAYQLLPEDNLELQSSTLRAFGRFYYYRGQLAESTAFHQRALSAAQTLGSEIQTASAMTQLGITAAERGDFGTALDYFEQAQAGNPKNGNLYYQLLNLRYIGMVHQLIGAYSLALDLFDSADALQKHLRYRDPVIQINRALCLLWTGDSEGGMALLENALLRQQDMYTQQLIELACINGLVLSERYTDCVVHGRDYLSRIQPKNPLLYARAQLWHGLAQHYLDIPEAVLTLQEALQHETTYGGRNIWQCHYALAFTTSEAQERQEHFLRALQTLQRTAATLQTRPALRALLYNHRFAREILQALHRAPD